MTDEMRGLTEWTREEALAIGSDLLTPPDDAKHMTRVVLKGKPGEREVTVKQWKELARVTFVKGPEAIDDDMGPYGHEGLRIGLQVDGERPSPNQKRLLKPDYLDVFSGLRTKSLDDLKALKATGSGIETKLYGYYFAMQRNVRRLAELLRALGYSELLENRRHFKGFPSIISVVPEFKGARVMVTLEQAEGDDGEIRDKVIGYSPVD